MKINIGIIVLIFVILLIGFAFWISVTNQMEVDEYCQDSGWYGVDLNNANLDSYRCVKHIPHHSGVGHTLEYSGRFSYKDIHSENTDDLE